MDFIDHEATEDPSENNTLVFSDDQEELTNDEMDDFINDTDQPRYDVSFYKQLDPGNIDIITNLLTKQETLRWRFMRMMSSFLETRTHNLSFKNLTIETMLSLINFQGLKDLSKNLKVH